MALKETKKIKDYRPESINVSEEFFNLLFKKKEFEGGYLEVFNNCREQGYVFSLPLTKGIIFDTVWAYENRNSDSIVVTVGHNSEKEFYGCFNESAYGRKEMFHPDKMTEAVDYALKYIGKEASDLLNFVGNITGHKIARFPKVVANYQEALKLHKEKVTNSKLTNPEKENISPSIIFQGDKPVYYITFPENEIIPWESKGNPFLNEGEYSEAFKKMEEGN